METPWVATLAVTVLVCMTFTFAQPPQPPPRGRGPPPRGGGGGGFPPPGPMPAWAHGTDPGELFPRHHWGLGSRPFGRMPPWAIGTDPAELFPKHHNPPGGPPRGPMPPWAIGTDPAELFPKHHHPPGRPGPHGPMPPWAIGTDPAELFPKHHHPPGGMGGAGGPPMPGGVNIFIPRSLQKAAVGMPPCRGWCVYHGENKHKFTQEQFTHLVSRLDKYATCGIPGVSRWNCSAPGVATEMMIQGLCYCKALKNGRMPGEQKCVINECGGCSYELFLKRPGGRFFERVLCD